MLKHEKSLDIGSEPLLFGTVCAKRGPRSRRTRISCEIRFLVPGIECAVFAAGEVMSRVLYRNQRPKRAGKARSKTAAPNPPDDHRMKVWASLRISLGGGFVSEEVHRLIG